MDIATIFGLLVGLALVVASVLLAEGIKGFVPFLNPEAFFVVMGGTFCALMVNYPVKEIFKLAKISMKVLTSTESEDTTAIISTFVELAKKARTDGFLALENQVKTMKNDFMKRGVQMVVDGLDKDFIANMMETEIGLKRERHGVGQEIFNALGTYSPAFGIIGTVLGMVLMLNSISDVEEVPRRMALALAAAFYGLGSGYLIFLPMAGKLKRKSEEEILVNEIIVRGVLLLQSGAIPSRIEDNLKAFLEPSKRALVKSSAGTK